MKIIFITYYQQGQDGCNVYISELSNALFVEYNLPVYVVTLGYPSSKINIQYKRNIKHINIPYIKQNEWMISICLLATIFENTTNNIIILGFTPSYEISKIIKTIFNRCKLIHVIHDFIWVAYVNGNVEYFKQIIGSKKNISTNIDFKNIFQDGIQTFNIDDAVICLSEDTKELLQDFYNVQKDKIYLIKNGLSDSHKQINKQEQSMLRKRYGINEDAIVFIFVGRLTEQKGINLLLDALNLLDCDYLNCTLVCIGEVRQEIISKLVNNKNKNRIVFTGVLEKNEVYDFYQLAKFGVVLSQYEQCSYVGIEMKMFSLPVIATKNYGVKNMFKNTCSIIVDNHPIDVSQAIERLVLNTDIKNLRIASRNDYLKHYMINTMCKKYIELFRHITNY